jgi:hypothetical protein
VKVENGRFEEFNIRIFSEESVLFKDTSKKLLKDLDLSVFDHSVTLQAVADGFEGLLADKAFYGLQDYGDLLDGRSFPNAPSIYATNTGQQHLFWKCKPYLHLMTIFDLIMAESGYTYDSTFLADTYAQSLYILAHSEGAEMSFTTDTIHLFKAGILTDLTLDPDNGDFTEIPFEDESSLDFEDVYGVNVFDEGFGSAAPGSAFLASYDSYTTGFYKLRCSLKFLGGAGASVYQVSLWRRVPGGSDVQDSTTFTVNVAIATDVIFTQDFNVFLAAYYFIRVKTITNSDVDLEAGADTYFECYESPQIPLDSLPSGVSLSFDATLNLPQETLQSDVLEFLDTRFNLLFIRDKGTPSHFIIEPYNDYVGTGTQKDWSQKLDVSKTYSVKPMSTVEKRELEWKTADGEDSLNKLVLDNAGRVYGRQKFINDVNEFATGTKTFTSPDVVSPLSALANNQGTTEYMIPRLYTGPQSPVKGDLRVFVKGGLYDATDSVNAPPTKIFKLRDYDNTLSTAIANYTHFGHYDDPIPDDTSTDLNFGKETPFHQMTTQPTDTCYERYWKTYLDQIYGEEARIMEGYFNLTLQDIEDFLWSDRIFAINAWWIVNKLTFDPLAERSSKVELIRFSNVLSQLNSLTPGDKPTPVEEVKYLTEYTLQNTSRQFVRGQGATILPLTDGTTEIDFQDSQMWSLLLEEDTVLQAPTNDMPTSGVIFCAQDSTGGWSLGFNATWKTIGDAVPTGADSIFSISFYSDGEGRIVANVLDETTAPAPLPEPSAVNYVSVAVDYQILSTDRFVEMTAADKTATLPLIQAEGVRYEVINSSTGKLTIDTLDSALINGKATKDIFTDEVLEVVSNGTDWIII